jgi:hypothetical protein
MAMKIVSQRGRRWSLALVAVVLLPWAEPRAQNYGSLPYSVPLDAPAVPDTPPEGAWGEVIMANSKWVVIQNHQGQQFPVRADAINRFLIRWPVTLTALGAHSVVEAIGNDLGSITVQTDHIDVFEGSAQTLVTPGATSFLPGGRAVTAIDPTFNRMLMGWDMAEQASLYGWAYPTALTGNGIPGRLHVVGHVVGLNPLRLQIPGNNLATVVPPTDPGTFTMSQVTIGSPSFAQKGDQAFLMPLRADPESLVLSQLVLYKKAPIGAFVP